MPTTTLPQAIQGLQKDNPRLYEAFKSLYQDIEKINKELFPNIVAGLNSILDVTVAAPINFNYEVLAQGVSFDWDDVINAAGYELRLGDTWDTSDFITRTVSSQALINPIL